jgi:RNA polymerase sigma-70 factor (ECF subfamily)
MHGDEEAFDTLVGYVGGGLHSVARRILRDPWLAEDATQRALVDAWRNLPLLKDPDHFEAWTYRLLVNACHAEGRRERRHQGNLHLLPHDEPMVSDVSAHVGMQDQIDRAFRSLSVDHRTVVVLTYYLGMTPSEAAAAMGTRPGTARSRLHYALRTMRAAIEADARLVARRGTA